MYVDLMMEVTGRVVRVPMGLDEINGSEVMGVVGDKGVGICVGEETASCGEACFHR